MNGQSSGAFRRALTDAVLEEYGEVPAAPKDPSVAPEMVIGGCGLPCWRRF